MKQTTLDLNGPILGFSTNPQDVTVNNAGIATFIGIASAYFISQNPTNIFASNTGIVTHRWYAAGIGALSDGTNTTLGATLSGTATTTLTLSNVTSPTTNGIQLFVSADYIPSAYQTTSPITAGTGRSTGNAINEILFSNTATLAVNPFVSISTQPSNSTVAQGRTATFSVTAASSNTTDVAYQWYIGGSPVSNGTSGGNTISGANTNTLTVTTSSNTPIGTSTVYVSVSHPTASNSPIFSNSANFIVVDPRQIINFEGYRGSTGDIIAPGFGSVNLFNGPYTNIADALSPNRILSIYASERDLPVRITMAGAAGVSRNGFSAGQGGVSVFDITMLKNIEYIIRLGSTTFPSGGANGGGGASFLFERARTIALCGGGGGAGTTGSGGNGGGISVSGLNGFGRNSGKGGGFFAPGTLPPVGFDAIGATPGRHSTCAWGDFWFNTGLSRCENFPGLTQAKTQFATNVSGTASINRGFKPGNLGHRGGGGNGSGNDGGGGAGVVGGSAATEGYGGGGGGGSGYHDGSINLISTQSGGNASTNGYLIIQSLL